MSAARAGEDGSNLAGRARPAGHADQRHLARHMGMGLTFQFLLGMAVNLIGQPSQTTGDARIASTAFLAARARLCGHGHRRDPGRQGRSVPGQPVAQSGNLECGRHRRHLAAGVLTTITKSNWWSYAMATGLSPHC